MRATLAVLPVSRPSPATASTVTLSCVEPELVDAVRRANGDDATPLVVCIETDGPPADERLAPLVRDPGWDGASVQDVVSRLRTLRAGGTPGTCRLAGLLAPGRSVVLIANDIDAVGAAVALLDAQLELDDWTDADRAEVTLAIREASLNAVVHGNLQVQPHLRDGDCALGIVIARQLEGSRLAARSVLIVLTLSANGLTCVVQDEGQGFDTGAVADPTAPENLALARGRGVSLMRALMDDVRFNDVGNEVTLVRRRPRVADPLGPGGAA